MQKPKVRFKGFTDDWEQRKFGELVEKYEDIVDTPTEGYTRLGIRSHAKGTFHSYVEKGKELETAKMFRVAANNFIVNITFGWEHAVAITDENDAGKLVSHRFPQYSFNEGKLPEFFKYLILDERFRHHLELSSPGGAGRNRVLKLNDMLDYKMSFPRTAEQEKVGMYFSHLDYIITFHQRKCEQTKKLKKYMLQKMFPKEGQTVPEIRFEGFTDAWEKRKLESLCDLFTDGDWIEAKDQSNLGVRLVQTGNVGITQYLDKENNKKWISEEKFEKLHCKEIFQGDILVSRLPDPAGRACIMPDLGTRMITAVDCTIIRTSKDCNSKYLVQYLSTPSYFKIVNSFLGGGTRQRISRGNLSTINIPIPVCLAEQEKIGRYFANLDHHITLHQSKCDELQNIKKFMLQNMFI